MIIPSVGFNRERRLWFLPRIKLLGRYYMPWNPDLYRVLLASRDFTVREEEDYAVVRGRGFVYYAPKAYVSMLIEEWRVWEKWYLPEKNMRFETVLDVGAGCGETAIFYRLHGARKVIPVEADRSLEKFIRANMRLNNINYELFMEPFSLRHLDLDFDLVKMDVEGGERLLLDAKIDFPLILETHGLELTREFLKRGFRMMVQVARDVFVLTNL